MVLTDDDVAKAVKLAGARDVVQLISYTTNHASFDSITEAAGLQAGGKFSERSAGLSAWSAHSTVCRHVLFRIRALKPVTAPRALVAR
jgi:hypothetical protein